MTDLKNNVQINRVTPRSSVEIHLPDGQVLSGPRGTCIGAFLASLTKKDEALVVGAVVNGELRELTYAIQMDSKVIPVFMTDPDGARIYRRSLTFLLSATFTELFPEFSLAVDHSVASGGYYCEVTGDREMTEAEMNDLEAEMRKKVEANLPFERKEVPLQEAIDYFEEQKLYDKTSLLKYRLKPFLVLYSLGVYRDYHHGYMVPSTGYLKWFSLFKVADGFILRFPRRHLVTDLMPLPEQPTLLETFRQYGNWLSKLGIENIGSLNNAIRENRIREVILVSEALHEQKIAEIASHVGEHYAHSRIVLIAGPSSSGKTTFSKRLAVQLLALGISPFAVELDNYFVDREKTPKDENGQYDFESISALNTSLLSDHLKRLIRGEEVQLAHFNFKTGKSEEGEVVRLGKDQIIILEGIHGLNPNLIPEISPDQTFRIYISALTQLNLDRHNRISTTDTRLIRRTVRDARERGYNPLQTIQRWESVRRGEKRHIFPYQEFADEMFNSALVYELSALKPLAEPVLRQVPFGTPEYIEAKRLLAFLEWFLPLDENLIPDNSILREFIGGSILRDFKLWDRADNNHLGS